MAALQTQVLVNGQWTTRTISTHTLLQQHNQIDESADENAMASVTPPTYGLLTQTVVPSPLLHLILPIKIRGPEYNDVAFIGDNFVEIRELRAGPHLYDVIRKDNFGLRIRNASVIGSFAANEHKQASDKSNNDVKTEVDGDIDMSDLQNGGQQHNSNHFPPETLVLQLESGTSSDSVFLFLRQSADGAWEFVSTRRRITKAMDGIQAGMHLAVDPYSRYMAIGGSERALTIQALQSRADITNQYQNSEDLRYIGSEKVIYFPGALLKMSFLYPASESDNDVILLLVLSTNGKIRLQKHVWQVGDDLSTIRSKTNKGQGQGQGQGHPVTDMPSLLIPIRFSTAFILVNEQGLDLYRGIRHGPLDFERTPMNWPAATGLYQGSGAPLWTAWAKPVRKDYYSQDNDDLFLAREDGAVNLVLVSKAGIEEDGVEATELGRLECNVGQAFTYLDYAAKNDIHQSDLLISGGDSSIGGAYLVLPKGQPLLKEYIYNWSPAMDLVAIGRNSAAELDIQNRTNAFIPNPESLFVCSGKGAQPSITELRSGIEAKIGLELEFGFESDHLRITKAWSLPSNVDPWVPDDGDLVLVTFAKGSAVVFLSSDAANAKHLESDETGLCLDHHTLAMSCEGDRVIQVTEQSIVFFNTSFHEALAGDDLMGFTNRDYCSSIYEAVISDNKVAYLTYWTNKCKLQLLEPVFDGSTKATPVTLWSWKSTETEITCLAMSTINRGILIVMASWVNSRIDLMFRCTDANHRSYNFQVTIDDQGPEFEALSSIVLVPGMADTTDQFVLLCGTKNGWLILLEIIGDFDDGMTSRITRCSHYRFGATPVKVTKDDRPGSFFVGCDSKVFIFTLNHHHSALNQGMHTKIERLYASDVSAPSMQQPAIQCMSRLGTNLSHVGNVFMFSDSTIYLAELGTQRKIIPRRILIRGAPTRIIYSRRLGVFIVAAVNDGKNTLLFVDPETGQDLSMPTRKKDGARADFVKGLGKVDEKIFCLYEWPFVKGTRTYNYVIACTSDGRVLIISAEVDRSPLAALPGVKSSIRNYLVYELTGERDVPKPVYSVVGDSEGLFYCAGTVLWYEVLDLGLKKFVKAAEIELPSEATSLTYEDDGVFRRIYALTRHHSLQVVEVRRGQMGASFLYSHSDQLARESLHHKIVGNEHSYTNDTHQCRIHLVSERGKYLTGLWEGNDMVIKTLDTVFEAQLPSSLLRLEAANCRPPWDISWNAPPETLILPNDPKGSEMLGMGIDGSLFHFSMLSVKAWRFLRFLANLAKQSEIVCEYTWDHETAELEPREHPKMMHVDGDVLRHVLDDRKLEDLFYFGRSEEMDGKKEVFARFTELLKEMCGTDLDGMHDPVFYIEKAYGMLEMFLRPVL